MLRYFSDIIYNYTLRKVNDSIAHIIFIEKCFPTARNTNIAYFQALFYRKYEIYKNIH